MDAVVDEVVEAEDRVGEDSTAIMEPENRKQSPTAAATEENQKTWLQITRGPIKTASQKKMKPAKDRKWNSLIQLNHPAVSQRKK